MHEDNPHRTRRHVKLPGGRQIEVVYLDSAPERTGEISAQLTRPATGAAADHTSTRASNDTPNDQRMTPEATGTPVDPRPVRASNDTPVTPRQWSGDSPSTAPGEALHVCPRCAGELVHPLDWV